MQHAKARCAAEVALTLILAACQPAPLVATPMPVPTPQPRVGLDDAAGVVAQLCAGFRTVAAAGLVRHSEPDLESPDGSAPRGAPETATLHDADAAAALDAVLRPDGPFCKEQALRRKSACGRWQSDQTVKKMPSGWFCFVRRGCGEWGHDEELCVGFIDGGWFPRFLNVRPSGEAVGKRAVALRRRVAVARRDAASVATKPPRPRKRSR